jgi:hypothetical protein
LYDVWDLNNFPGAPKKFPGKLLRVRKQLKEKLLAIPFLATRATSGKRSEKPRCRTILPKKKKKIILDQVAVDMGLVESPFQHTCL